MATSWYISGFIDPWCGIGDNIPQSLGTYHCLNADIFFLLYDNDDSNGHLIVGQLIFLRIFIRDGLQISSAAIIKTLVEFSLTLDFKAV